MSKQDFIKGQTCILKVDIHCEGCKDKVKKKLQKIDGVYAVKIEAEQGKVTVTGTIDSTTLIKKLLKAGKHAELWGPQKQPSTNNQSKNMQQIDGSKDNNNNKSQKGSSGNIGKQQQNNGNGGVFQQMQNVKGSTKDLKFPKDQKIVKFKTTDEDFDEDSDEFGDEFDDGFDDDDDFDGHPLKPTKKTGGGGGGNNNNGSKGDNGMMKGALGGGGGGNGKKSGGGTEKANEDKNVNVGKNGKGGGKQNQSGGQGGKNGGGMVGGEGKNGSNANGKASNNGGKNGGGGGKMNGEDHHMQMGGKNMTQMGMHPQMPQMGNYPRGGQMAAAGQGLPPTMNPGLYQGMGQQGNPYMNQQQYMAQMMMMNQQQQAYGNGMYQHPMMYARPMAAAMPPHPPSEDYGFMFSDENANSCSIM